MIRWRQTVKVKNYLWLYIAIAVIIYNLQLHNTQATHLVYFLLKNKNLIDKDCFRYFIFWFWLHQTASLDFFWWQLGHHLRQNSLLEFIWSRNVDSGESKSWIGTQCFSLCCWNIKIQSVSLCLNCLNSHGPNP